MQGIAVHKHKVAFKKLNYYCKSLLVSCIAAKLNLVSITVDAYEGFS